MAWPFSRLVDFLPNSVPRIGAAFLNTLQDTFIGVFSGTKTLKSVHVDGIGDQPSTASPGDVLISGSSRPQKTAFSATLPTPTVALDEDTKGEERCAVFTIAVPGDPASFAGGETVVSITRTGVGTYQIVWDVILGVSANSIACGVNWHATGHTATVVTTDSMGAGGRLRTDVVIMNSALNAVDAAGRFSVVVHPR